MGGVGGSPAPPAPVAVPSAADEEAASERARLYSLLRSRRGGRGLMYGPTTRRSLLSVVPAKQAASLLGPVLSLPYEIGGGEGGPGDMGGGGDGGPGGVGGADSGPGGMGSGGGGMSGGGE